MARRAEHDTSIRAYEAKRDFAVTREPRPARRGNARRAPIFVVQKHRARRAGLHWDFRLEHNGVLLSWAVRKGPSLDPADKRIAVHVEDHPLDYADFQGGIPEGYGAGEVELWDRGTWQPLEDPEQGMRDGEIKLTLSGSRLRGRFTLVRMRPRGNAHGRQDNWLLIKGHDAEERSGLDAAALEAAAPPPDEPADKSARRSTRIVTARAPKARTEMIEGVTLTHPDRELWPGISKRDLAGYWQSVADWALPGLIHRPLAVLRCPEGVDGEHFFQKHAHGTMPLGVREGGADGQPYLAIDSLQGLMAMAQMSAIELHAWGATEADPLHADQLVFDLDPGEGVKMPAITAAAIELRDRLTAIGLAAFCRTSGGKGLHVVVPLQPGQPWDAVRAFCKRFAEEVSAQAPERYLSHVRVADRSGRILIDWLRNGIGATAVASFCPRARAGAHVATPLSWQEVTPRLDPAAFTMQTVPARLRKLKADPWDGFDAARRPLPTPPEAPKGRAAGQDGSATGKGPRRRNRSG